MISSILLCDTYTVASFKFMGKQIFAGSWGRYFVIKLKMSLWKITLTCVLGLLTNYGKSFLSYILLGKFVIGVPLNN